MYSPVREAFIAIFIIVAWIVATNIRTSLTWNINDIVTDPC